MTKCDDCEHEIVFDYASDNLSWNKTCGTPDNPRGEGIMLCINCFVAKALAKGVHPHFKAMFILGSEFHWKEDNSFEELEARIVRQQQANEKLQRKYNVVKGSVRSDRIPAHAIMYIVKGTIKRWKWEVGTMIMKKYISKQTIAKAQERMSCAYRLAKALSIDMETPNNPREGDIHDWLNMRERTY